MAEAYCDTPGITATGRRRRRRHTGSSEGGALGSLTSTDVTAQLFFKGHRVNRDRLAEIADALWLRGEVRPGPKTHRRYTPEQVDQISLALDLMDGLKFPLEDLSRLIELEGSIDDGLVGAINAIREHLLGLEARVRREPPTLLAAEDAPAHAMSA